MLEKKGPTPKALLILMLFCLCFAACQKELINNQNNQDSPISSDPPEGETSNESDENTLSLYAVDDGELIKIKDFDVPSQYLSDQADTQKHLQMWSFFKEMIPPQQLSFVNQFEVFKSEDNVAGYVQNLNGDNFDWKIGLSIDFARNLDEASLKSSFTYICIHEFAHILTLNNTQIGPRQADCSTWAPYSGCSYDDAYIDELYDIGWKDIYNEYLTFDADENLEFYQKYENRFVSLYAATSPSEDIAEVFSYFVLEDGQPAPDNIANQKINAMYDRPELLELRYHIRNTPGLNSLILEDLPKMTCKHTNGKVIMHLEAN